MPGAFVALLQAVQAAQAGDANALRAALLASPPQQFFGKAVVHRCAGRIYEALARYRVRDPATQEIRRMLQGYAAHCVSANQHVVYQLCGISEALSAAGIAHAPLKGAARLLAHDPGARWSHMDDIDILIPRELSDAAVRALADRGYRFNCDLRAQNGYRALHHHLAPLVPDDGGKPVELHVNLEFRPWFSTRTDWAALSEHLVPYGGSPAAFALDAFGRALHALIHAVGLYRLGDVAVLAAELQDSPGLLEPLVAWTANERKVDVALRAVLHLAARIAHVALPADLRAERYLEWVMWREGAPRIFRARMQLLDAYFAGAISIGLPERFECDGAKSPAVQRMRVCAVRLGAAIGAAACRGLGLR